MAQRLTPEAEQSGPRDPIKPLRIKDEEPGGFIGILIWWRKRGGVFWWMAILVVLSIGTFFIVAIPVARTMGHLDYRSPPDITATISVDKAAVSKGDTVVLTVAHHNIGGSEAGAVTVDIILPDELMAKSVQPGTPACSQAGKLERFASQEAGDITGEAGGTMKCLLGTRVTGAKGDIIIEAEVGDVADGAKFNIDVWLATYRTDNVAKEEGIWSNNCASLTLGAGPGGQAVERPMECSSLAFVARSVDVRADEDTVASGGTLTLTVEHENVGGDEAEGVAIDIMLPDELTASTMQRFVDERALPGHPNCSHPNQLEAFEREGTGTITETAGGALTCIAGSRKVGAISEIELTTTVGSAASGSTINVNVCARSEQAAGAAEGDCTMLAVPVQ